MARRGKVVLDCRRAAPLQDPRHPLRAAGLVSGHRRYAGPRASKKAPDVGFHFDHSRKPNRSRYIWGQGWVTLAAVVHAKTVATSWAVPLISRLVRKTGNHGKLTGARVLLRIVRGLFGQGRLLLDTWFMR